MSEVNTPGNNHASESTMTTARIWRVFWILLAITVVEVVWGMKVSHHIPYKWVNAVFFLSMTFVKAGYIVAEFMHLRYEITNMIRSVLIPLVLFVWFVVAFCMDGDSWLNLRSRYSPRDVEKAKVEEAAPREPGTLK
jgi:cytochrome c oxidase subunit IV